MEELMILCYKPNNNAGELVVTLHVFWSWALIPNILVGRCWADIQTVRFLGLHRFYKVS